MKNLKIYNAVHDFIPKIRFIELLHIKSLVVKRSNV